MQEVMDAAREARDSGVYPDGLEEQLQSDFARQLSRPDPRDRIKHLDGLLEQLSARRMGRAAVETSSAIPGGSAAHRAIGKVVSRQVDGVYQQMNNFTAELVGVLGFMMEGLQDPQAHVHTEMLRELDALQDRVAELQVTIDSLGSTYREATGVMSHLLVHLNSLDGLEARLAALEESERRRGFDPFFEYGRFEDVARGAESDIEVEYSALADQMAGSPGPVLDIGAGRGEFLRLLQERDQECWGLEIDEDLVRDAIDAGIDIRLTDGLEGLREQPLGSLGGIVMLHVVEHLSVNELMELVLLAYDRLAVGGTLVMETPNPQSLYVFARAFWLDPTHSKPVHPVFLDFLVRQAGFSEVRIDWTAPPSEDEQLLDAGHIAEEPASRPEAEPAADRDLREQLAELAAVVSANAERTNDLVFGPQNYRLTARR